MSPAQLAAIRERAERAQSCLWSHVEIADHYCTDIPLLLAALEEQARELERCRTMFDVTRHRVCDALGVEHGKSWSAIESLIVATRCAAETARASLAGAEEG